MEEEEYNMIRNNDGLYSMGMTVIFIAVIALIGMIAWVALNPSILDNTLWLAIIVVVAVVIVALVVTVYFFILAPIRLRKEIYGDKKSDDGDIAVDEKPIEEKKEE